MRTNTDKLLARSTRGRLTIGVRGRDPGIGLTSGELLRNFGPRPTGLWLSSCVHACVCLPSLPHPSPAIPGLILRIIPTRACIKIHQITQNICPGAIRHWTAGPCRSTIWPRLHSSYGLSSLARMTEPPTTSSPLRMGCTSCSRISQSMSAVCRSIMQPASPAETRLHDSRSAPPVGWPPAATASFALGISRRDILPRTAECAREKSKGPSKSDSMREVRTPPNH